MESEKLEAVHDAALHAQPAIGAVDDTVDEHVQVGPTVIGSCCLLCLNSSQSPVGITSLVQLSCSGELR